MGRDESLDELPEVQRDDALDRFSRRAFLERLGGGIAFLVTVGPAAATAAPAGRQRGSVPTDFNAFLRIGRDGRVTCLTGKIEMGQGPITSLPQMLADELDVPYESVDIVMGDTDLCPWDMGTWGSLTTRQFGPILRAAGAEARGVLVELASDALGVPVSRLRTRDGQVFDSKSPRQRISYATLAKGAPIARHLEVEPRLKKASEFRVMGKPMRRRDAIEKVTGKASYAADVRLPNMLYARLLRPPTHAATLRKAHTSGALEVLGAQVIKTGGLVAVLHEAPDLAAKALGRVTASFDVPRSNVDDRNIHAHLRKVAPRAGATTRGGNLDAGRRRATKVTEQTYLDSYVAHAPLETHAALATIEDGKCTVWASTQNPFGARDKIARALGMKRDSVRVITPHVGGGFGGKTGNQQAVEAALLAKAAGRPVQVMRTREEEFFYDNLRPAAIVDIRSGVDASGRIAFWDYEVLFAGERGAAQYYDIPNHRTVARPSRPSASPGDHPFATGAWRAPGNSTNTFARESQIDVMASAVGSDPVEFRLKHLSDSRMSRVIKAAASRFGWKPGPAPSRRGQGMACGIDAGTYVCAMAEVEVDRGSGRVAVRRVVCAQDMGFIVNPRGATLQVESCVTMGLGYALTEELHFASGRLLDTNFDRYAIPRFSDLPDIETVLIEDRNSPPQGGGEPAIVVMGGVLANAIYDACGARVQHMPMTPARVKAALAAASRAGAR